MLKKKKALIIRSASFQQLDINLPSIQQQMPDYTFDLLTHEHGLKLAEKYTNIKDIIVYPFKASFNKNQKLDLPPEQHYDAVIYLTTNLTGLGFGNVLRFAFTIRATKYLQCNMNSKLEVVSIKQYRLKWFKSVTLKTVSLFITSLCSIIAIPYLLYKFLRINNKSSLGE